MGQDEARAAEERAQEALRLMEERQPEFDALERWGRREAAINGFSDRMRRGMGGGR